MELPATSERVTRHTAQESNARIMKEMEYRLWYFYQHPEEIEQRLQELDTEWDIERLLESNAASLALTGVLLGVAFNRKFLFLPLIVTGFLLQHALQGWCPPVPFFRRLGVRTQSEIELERYALRALRGDFGPLEASTDVATDKEQQPAKILRVLRK